MVGGLGRVRIERRRWGRGWRLELTLDDPRSEGASPRVPRTSAVGLELSNRAPNAALGNSVVVSGLTLQLRDGGRAAVIDPVHGNGARSWGLVAVAASIAALSLVLALAAGGSTWVAGMGRAGLGLLCGLLVLLALGGWKAGLVADLGLHLMGTASAPVQQGRVACLALTAVLLLVGSWPSRIRWQGAFGLGTGADPSRDVVGPPSNGHALSTRLWLGPAGLLVVAAILWSPPPVRLVQVGLLALGVLLTILPDGAGGVARAFAAGGVCMAGLGAGLTVVRAWDVFGHLLSPACLALMGVVGLAVLLISATLGARRPAHALLAQALLLVLLELQAAGAINSQSSSTTDLIQSGESFALGMVRDPTPTFPQTGGARSLRVIFYGGSVVEGIGLPGGRELPQGERFVSVVGVDLARSMGVSVETLNAGRGGFTTHHARRGVVVGRHLERLRPRLVVLMTGHNDCKAATREGRAEARGEGKTLRELEAIALQGRSGLRSLLAASSIYRLLAQAVTWAAPRVATGVGLGYTGPQVPAADARANLKEIVLRARRLGVAVLLASESHYPAVKNSCYAAHREVQQGLARSFEHVGYVGVYEWFARNGRRAHFVDEVHYGRSGHRLAARLLSQQIVGHWPGGIWLSGSAKLGELPRINRVVERLMPPKEPGR